jgi:hypothetical protein
MATNADGTIWPEKADGWVLGRSNEKSISTEPSSSVRAKIPLATRKAVKSFGSESVKAGVSGKPAESPGSSEAATAALTGIDAE